MGRELSLELLRRGAKVAAVDMRPETLEETKNLAKAISDNIATFPLDITDAKKVAALPSEVKKALGNTDALINNAGIIQEKPFLDTTETDWDRMLATDLKSVFLVSRAVLPGMVARGGGVIVNLASDLGILGRENYAPYCAAKAGVIGLTKSLAREFAPHCIRVNAIAPGPVNTAMVSLESMSPEWMEKELAIPQHRVAEPEEIAATALFLVSDLSRFYCGQVLGPNGGSVMP